MICDTEPANKLRDHEGCFTAIDLYQRYGTKLGSTGNCFRHFMSSLAHQAFRNTLSPHPLQGVPSIEQEGSEVGCPPPAKSALTVKPAKGGNRTWVETELGERLN